jgi:hypothetical protein
MVFVPIATGCAKTPACQQVGMPTLKQIATPLIILPLCSLITKMNSLRIIYSRFFTYRYPNKK